MIRTQSQNHAILLRHKLRHLKSASKVLECMPHHLGWPSATNQSNHQQLRPQLHNRNIHNKLRHLKSASISHASPHRTAPHRTPITPSSLKTRFKSIQTLHNVIIVKLMEDVNTYFDYLAFSYFFPIFLKLIKSNNLQTASKGNIDIRPIVHYRYLMIVDLLNF